MHYYTHNIQYWHAIRNMHFEIFIRASGRGDNSNFYIGFTH